MNKPLHPALQRASEAVAENRNRALQLVDGGTSDMVAKAQVHATLAVADAIVLATATHTEIKGRTS